MGTQPASSLASAISYLPFGPLKTLTWGNGIQLTRQYDQDYQLAGQTIGSWQSTYSFDANGNIKGRNHSLFGNLNYSYDALDRLTEEKDAAQRKAYSYDATGNRTTRLSYTTTAGVEKKVATQTLFTAPDSNRLQKNGSTVLTLDAAGNTLTQSTSRTYIYNEQGRLSEVRNPTNPYASYSYNALGQRTLKRLYSSTNPTTPSSTTSYLYGADGQLLGQVTFGSTGKKTKAQYWVWLDGLPLAGIEQTFTSTGAVASTKQYYLHSDHLNTPRQATDASQKLLWSWNSDAFGVGTPNGDVDGDGIALDMPLRFPGQQYDANSGLNYNYFRDYDPQTGRYVESDPIGLAGGLNTYGYVMGNPLSYTDPKGLDIFCGVGKDKVGTNEDGSVKCRDNGHPEESPCFGTDCKIHTPGTNSQCYAKCMADPNEVPTCPGLPKGGLIVQLAYDYTCGKTAQWLSCATKCDQEVANNLNPLSCPIK
jgi:RHS repeat-associated protein